MYHRVPRDRRQLVPAVFRRKQICNASRTKNDVRVNPYHRIILPVPTGPESDRTRSVLQHAVYRAALFLWRGFQPCETFHVRPPPNEIQGKLSLFLRTQEVSCTGWQHAKQNVHGTDRSREEGRKPPRRGIWCQHRAAFFNY